MSFPLSHTHLTFQLHSSTQSTSKLSNLLFIPLHHSHPTRRHVKCQRLQGHCRMSDVACLKTPLSYSIHLIPLHFDFIKIPLNIFTMAAPKTLNYRLSFTLDITSSYQPLSGVSNSIDDRYFYLKQVFFLVQQYNI